MAWYDPEVKDELCQWCGKRKGERVIEGLWVCLECYEYIKMFDDQKGNHEHL